MCATHQCHWAVRPGCAYNLAVPGIPVGGSGQGRARPQAETLCTSVLMCVSMTECRPRFRTWARMRPGVPHRGLHAELCGCTCTRPRSGHVRPGHRRGWAEPGSSPERARGQGRLPRGLWRDVVGAVLVLAKAAIMGEAPGSRRGRNKEEKGEGRREGGLQRRRKRRKCLGMQRAQGSRGAECLRLGT